MRFYVDYAVSLYATEVIEAESKEEALAIMAALDRSDSWEWDERLLAQFRECPIMLENSELVDVIEAGEGSDITLTKEDIDRYMKGV